MQHINIEKLLRDADSRLRMISRLGRIGTWSVDTETRKVTWSDELYEIHGVDRGTVISPEMALDLYTPEWREIITSAFARCVGRGIPFDLELEIFAANGRRAWVRTIGEAVIDEAGAVVLIQGAFQDLSDQKHVQDEARRAAARLTTTLESLTIGFITMNSEWLITYFNAQS